MKKDSNIEIITTGEELLSGTTLDTNFFSIAEKVFTMGLKIRYHQCVGDSKNDIISALKIANSRSSFVIITGGLGPTEDDLTREVASEYFSKELIFIKKEEEKIKKLFAKRKRKYSSLNKKQAYFPKGSSIINNVNGTASGFTLIKSSTKFYFFPGVPKEFNSMIKNSFLKDLASVQKKMKLYSFSKTLKIFGAPESEVAERINKISRKRTYIGFRPYNYEIHLRLITQSNTLSDAKKETLATEKKIRKVLGDLIFTDENITLAHHVVLIALKKKVKISIAESCTGGLLSSMITDVPGSSKFFEFGAITYSNKAKESILDVKSKSLLTYGAVSKNVVSEMAKNIRNKSNTDISVAISGIAGPTGGTKDKPVGTVFIGLSSKKGTRVTKYSLSGSRESIKLRTCLIALDKLRKELIN
tara:strand:- start:2492 stop:3739 length:1248 start_codon:yes stop_codon:yes gene_type:complete